MATIVVGVTGGVGLRTTVVRERQRAGHDVARGSDARLEFVGRSTWEGSSRPVAVERVWKSAEHVELARVADLIIVPATAKYLCLVGRRLS